MATVADTSIRDLLGDVAPGTPTCVFAHSISDALASLELSAVANLHRLVLLRWTTTPRIDEAIKRVVDDLATVAKSAWPSWFGISESSDKPDRDSLIQIAEEHHALPDWIIQAWNLCSEGRPPLPPIFPQTITTKHLALAIDPDDLTVVLTVEDAKLQDARLDGLCRVAQWLAVNTHARICLLLDHSLQRSPELASIDYEPLLWRAEDFKNRIEPGIIKPESKLGVWPLAGKPHPLSPGELKLSRALENDEFLANLFEFNRPVKTSHDQTYFVDLLARNEKVIVEVDGYTHHSNRVAFSVDRQRDYELHTSGFLVLRLAHDELMNDMDSCLAKIRCFILFRREHPNPGA